MKNIENISKNLELIQRQYNQEEAYYFIINKLIRDSIDDKDISVRDVHKLIRAKDFPGRNSYLRGYAGQVPDFVILHNDFEESKGEGQSGKVYGCVEIKAFSKENKKLDRKYIQPIKKLLKNKELVKVVLEKIYQNWIKIEFESSKKKEGISPARSTPSPASRPNCCTPVIIRSIIPRIWSLSSAAT